MAFIMAPADNRMANIGRGISNGAGFIANQMNRQNNMELQNRLQQENMQKRQEFLTAQAIQRDELALNRFKSQVDFQQQQQDMNHFKMFGGNAQVPIADGQPQIPIQGEFTPQNQGMTQQAFNNYAMQNKTGVALPKQTTSSSYGYKEWASNNNLPLNDKTYKQFKQSSSAGSNKGGTPSPLGKLISEMKQYPIDSPEYKAYTEKIEYITKGKISPDMMMFMTMFAGDNGKQPQVNGNSFGFLPTEGNATKTPQGSIIQNFMNN